MERETGFEPATPTLARLYSTTELFPLSVTLFILHNFFCQLKIVFKTFAHVFTVALDGCFLITCLLFSYARRVSMKLLFATAHAGVIFFGSSGFVVQEFSRLDHHK